MNTNVDYPFTHGVFQTREIMHEFCKVIENHPDTEIDYDFDKAIFKRHISISYNNHMILVTEINLDRTCDFLEVEFSHTITFITDDGIKRRYTLSLVDAEFIKLLMESL